MERCDPNAKRRCPDGKNCELYAEFADGSWCDIFNESALKQPMTNADRIRAMSDEELAELLNRVKEPCDCCQLAVVEGACTETLCDDAMIKWLQQPAEELKIEKE